MEINFDLIELLESKDCDISILEKFYKDDNWLIKSSIAENINCPTSILESLADDPCFSVRISVAKNSNCNEFIFNKLFCDDNESVRNIVASHKKCPEHILEKMFSSKDNNYLIRSSIIRNNNCPIFILEELSDNVASKAVHHYNDNDDVEDILHNEKCSSSILNKLLNFSNSTNLLIIYHKNCTENILNVLSKSNLDYIRESVARSDKCSVSILDYLSNDKNILVLYNILSNKNCPEYLIIKLFDVSPTIALLNPNCPNFLKLLHK